MTGPALEEQLQQAFSPWGKATGLVSDETGLLVAFEGGIQIKFIPASVQFNATSLKHSLKTRLT